MFFCDSLLSGAHLERLEGLDLKQFANLFRRNHEESQADVIHR